jgi:restriction system protein
VWALTPKGRDTPRINEHTIVTAIRKAYVARRKEQNLPPTPQNVQEEAVQEAPAAEEIETELSWKQQVLDAILAMSPEAFERLSQRLLRESGFTPVEVTGRSRDGGIDGKGHRGWPRPASV